MKAIGYIRVSTEEQASGGISLDAQRQSIIAYCQLRSLELVTILEDAGVSAGKVLHSRPAGREIGRFLKKGARSIIAYKLDRLFRDASDCLLQTREWDASGIALHLLDLGGQAIDTSSAMGRFFLTVIAGAAEMERNLIRERTRHALAHKRSLGLRISHKAPFGFSFNDDQIILHPGEQSVLTHIWNMRKSGESYQDIADRLETMGYRNREGHKWSKQGIWKIFKATRIKSLKKCQQGYSKIWANQ